MKTPTGREAIGVVDVDVWHNDPERPGFPFVKRESVSGTIEQVVITTNADFGGTYIEAIVTAGRLRLFRRDRDDELMEEHVVTFTELVGDDHRMTGID